MIWHSILTRPTFLTWTGPDQSAVYVVTCLPQQDPTTPHNPLPPETLRLLGAYYAVYSARLLLMLAGTAVYVLSPLDLLPDALLGPIGLLDDLLVFLGMAFLCLEFYRPGGIERRGRHPPPPVGASACAPPPRKGTRGYTPDLLGGSDTSKTSQQAFRHQEALEAQKRAILSCFFLLLGEWWHPTVLGQPAPSPHHPTVRRAHPVTDSTCSAASASRDPSATSRLPLRRPPRRIALPAARALCCPHGTNGRWWRWRSITVGDLGASRCRALPPASGLGPTTHRSACLPSTSTHQSPIRGWFEGQVGRK